MIHASKKFSKDYYFMVIGQIISVLGAALLRFALALYVLDLTGSEVIFGALLAISNAPLLLSPLGGAIADRFNRRNLMVIFDLISGGIVFVFYFALLAMPESVMLIAVTIMILSVVSALDNPTGASAIPSMVKEDELEAANGILQAVEALPFGIAPFVGGFLYGVLGLEQLIILCAVAFFAAAIAEMFINIPFVKRVQTGHIIPTLAKDIQDGFFFVVNGGSSKHLGIYNSFFYWWYIHNEYYTLYGKCARHYLEQYLALAGRIVCVLGYHCILPLGA